MVFIENYILGVRILEGLGNEARILRCFSVPCSSEYCQDKLMKLVMVVLDDTVLEGEGKAGFIAFA